MNRAQIVRGPSHPADKENHMSSTNRYLAEQAAVYKDSPITFTSTTGSADVAAAVATTDSNIQLIIDMISLEGADADVKRWFLDEMSPAARVTLYKILTDLQTATAA
jgi:hypothetical protein